MSLYINVINNETQGLIYREKITGLGSVGNIGDIRGYQYILRFLG